MAEHPPSTASPSPQGDPSASSQAMSADERAAFSRLYFNARREAIITFALWLLTLFWTVGYCYLRGYQHAPDSWVVQQGWAIARSPDSLPTFFGFPDWIFFGIVAPWGVCTLFTIVFSIWIMQDDDLGVEKEEPGHEL